MDSGSGGFGEPGMFASYLVPLVGAVMTARLIWRLGRRLAWPEYWARLWQGAMSLGVVLCLCVLSGVLCVCVGALCGWFALPFRSLWIGLEGRIFSGIYHGLRHLWRASWILGVSCVCVFIFLAGCFAGGRLRRPFLKNGWRLHSPPLWVGPK